jgi:hypothetical protein
MFFFIPQTLNSDPLHTECQKWSQMTRFQKEKNRDIPLIFFLWSTKTVP